MNLSLRILLGYILILALAAWFVFYTFREEIKPGVRQAQEATLADTANVLARLAAADLSAGHIADGAFAAALKNLDRQPIDAQVWGIRKTRIDFRVYVTDSRGVVVFDSTGSAVGRDYSRWNDVYLTLQGRYGIRSTRSDPKDENSSTMVVAAPIRFGNQIIGVLSVAKPNRMVQPFVERGRRNIRQAGFVLLGVSLLIGLLFAYWINRSLRQLLVYAEKVGRGEKADPPGFRASELATLSQALADMREKLEGKQYVERYVHTLTHEMKSPLTALRGTAELLVEEMPQEHRIRFAATVGEQTLRIQQLVDKMLDLASVEAKQRLENVSIFPIVALVQEQLALRAQAIGQRQLALDLTGLTQVDVAGDRFLLGQAIGNLLDNAMDFSPVAGVVAVATAMQGTTLVLTVADRGAGIPDFAQERVFERFYSLPRPTTGMKSTGLGLPFVREVAALHGGSVALANRGGGGAVATLRIGVRC